MSIPVICDAGTSTLVSESQFSRTIDNFNDALQPVLSSLSYREYSSNIWTGPNSQYPQNNVSDDVTFVQQAFCFLSGGKKGGQDLDYTLSLRNLVISFLIPVCASLI